MTDDDTRVVAAPGTDGKQQVLYPLQPGDPRWIRSFRCVNRLKPTTEEINDDKPTPLLAQLPAATADGEPDFVVIKILTGNPTLAGRTRLTEEEAWSREQAVYRDSAYAADSCWVARDFYQGVSLDQLVGRPEWTPQHSTTLARVILGGIRQVHGRREIHCDVKPANVIVNGRKATLIDFESSRNRQELSPREVEATKPYASPEQLFGGGPDRPLLAATDLFSWALTVCHLFAPGTHPYCAGPFDESVMRAIDNERGRVPTPEPDVSAVPPTGLRDALRTALAWDPAARMTADHLLTLLGETGTNTAVLVGATQVLRPQLPDEPDPTPTSPLRRFATSDGVLGDETVPWETKLIYAGSAFLLAFVLAFVTFVLLGVAKAG